MSGYREVTVEELENNLRDHEYIGLPFRRGLDELKTNLEPSKTAVNRDYEAIALEIVNNHAEIGYISLYKLMIVSKCDGRGRHQIAVAVKKAMNKLGWDLRMNEYEDGYMITRLGVKGGRKCQ